MEGIGRALLVAVMGVTMASLSASAGQFKKAIYYGAGQRPYTVIATQFTQSGNTDLAVAGYVTPASFRTQYQLDRSPRSGRSSVSELQNS
jgi:hypothetical protein